MSEVTKPCTKCREVKPLSEYHLQPGGLYGRHPRCKECRRRPKVEKPAGPAPTERTCKKCDETKPLEDFKKVKGNKFGRGFTCKDCEAARMRGLRKTPKHREWSREYEQRPEVKQKREEWQASDRGRAYMKDYYAQLPVRMAGAARNASKKAETLGLECCLEGDDLVRLWELAEGRCAYCGAEAEEVDHIMPFELGGLNCIENVAPACEQCNRGQGGKWARDPAEWIAGTPGLIVTEPPFGVIACAHKSAAAA